MFSKLDNKNRATLLEISDVANPLVEAQPKLAEGFQYFVQVKKDEGGDKDERTDGGNHIQADSVLSGDSICLYVYCPSIVYCQFIGNYR